MLEPKTIQKVNELIQGMTRFCIKSYQSGQPIDSDDIRALAELIASVNGPPDQPNDLTPAIGFPLPVPAGDDE